VGHVGYLPRIIYFQVGQKIKFVDRIMKIEWKCHSHAKPKATVCHW